MCEEKNRARSISGMILVEILVAMAVAAFVTGALFQAVITLQKGVYRWDRSMRMRQGLTAAMFRLGADLRMAGCNPWENGRFDAVDAGQGDAGRVRRFTLRLDKRGKAVGSGPDGDADDPDERIEYRWDSGEKVLRRNGQPVLLGIHDNPPGSPFFALEEKGGHGLARVLVSVVERGETRSFLMAVCIRNPL